jgi:hypothetical protein
MASAGMRTKLMKCDKAFSAFVVADLSVEDRATAIYDRRTVQRVVMQFPDCRSSDLNPKIWSRQMLDSRFGDLARAHNLPSNVGV